VAKGDRVPNHHLRAKFLHGVYRFALAQNEKTERGIFHIVRKTALLKAQSFFSIKFFLLKAK
jgi:hypothetical protein